MRAFGGGCACASADRGTTTAKPSSRMRTTMNVVAYLAAEGRSRLPKSVNDYSRRCIASLAGQRDARTSRSGPSPRRRERIRDHVGCDLLAHALAGADGEGVVHAAPDADILLFLGHVGQVRELPRPLR